MQHKDLTIKKWSTYSLAEQMANIGSEIERAIKWKKAGNIKLSREANMRALELFILTLQTNTILSQLREITRAKELWLDFFLGDNQYSQTEQMWQKYFYGFTYLARNKL